MKENEFTERLVALLNEFRKEKETSYVVGIAKDVVYEWQSIQDHDDRIDEVRCDFIDGDGAVVIDVWTHGNEDGFSVARILPDNTVEWTNSFYKDCPKVMEVINEVIAS